MSVLTHEESKQWQTICSVSDLVENSGVCALIKGIKTESSIDKQVAIFHLPHTEQQVFAIGNYDPIGHANVLYRGIVGSVGDEIVVASPLYKQHFNLESGQCLQEDISTDAYHARIVDNDVQLLV